MQRKLFVQAFLTALLGLVALAPAMAAPFEVPPIVDGPNQQRHPGKVIFAEMVTPDMGATKRFYGDLFGWTYEDFHGNGIDYAEAYKDGNAVAGLLHRDVPRGQQRQPAWLTFIASRDVAASTLIATQHGARVLFEPHRIPSRGQQAVLADPQGAVFAILDSSSGDPADDLADPGEWIWSSLITRDPDNAAAFYQALFNYEIFEMPSADGAQHLVLATDGFARASANSAPWAGPNFHPHWLNYVRVNDAVAMAARVVSLGGRVIVEPRLDRHGGMVAVVADPMGAPFGLIEWTDAQGAEVTK